MKGEMDVHNQAGAGDAGPAVCGLIEKLLPGTAGQGMSVEPGMRLGADLNLGSLAYARLIGMLRKHYAHSNAPFHKLLVQKDGTLARDLRVSDVIEFVRLNVEQA